MRRKVIVGNWKMNKSPEEAVKFIQEFIPLVKDTDVEVGICAPYVDLKDLVEATKGTNVKIGAQNMHWAESGTYTGEISGYMLKAIGVHYVILGHSERRQNMGETSEMVNKKLKTALEIGLHPIVCVGETREERDNDKTEEVIAKQLVESLDGITKEQVSKVILAYEPVWAISSGLASQKSGENRAATNEDANNGVKLIRNEIAKLYGDSIAEEIIIQYGGSMKSSNTKELNNMSDIDGGLVGGASTEPVEFSKTIHYNS